MPECDKQDSRSKSNKQAASHYACVYPMFGRQNESTFGQSRRLLLHWNQPTICLQTRGNDIPNQTKPLILCDLNLFNYFTPYSNNCHARRSAQKSEDQGYVKLGNHNISKGCGVGLVKGTSTYTCLCPCSMHVPVGVRSVCPLSG